VYDELYAAWRREKENVDLQPLSKDFYSKLAEYMHRLREESRMLDEKSTRARLLMRESKNVKEIVKSLILLRHEKTLKQASVGEALPKESMTPEEEKLAREIAPSFESFNTFLKDILNGRLPRVENKGKPSKEVLRFRKEIPAIIGVDMKTYGPFKPEDIASLPGENAKILVKQGVAIQVEVKR